MTAPCLHRTPTMSKGAILRCPGCAPKLNQSQRNNPNGAVDTPHRGSKPPGPVEFGRSVPEASHLLSGVPAGAIDGDPRASHQISRFFATAGGLLETRGDFITERRGSAARPARPLLYETGTGPPPGGRPCSPVCSLATMMLLRSSGTGRACPQDRPSQDGGVPRRPRRRRSARRRAAGWRQLPTGRRAAQGHSGTRRDVAPAPH